MSMQMRIILITICLPSSVVPNEVVLTPPVNGYLSFDLVLSGSGDIGLTILISLSGAPTVLAIGSEPKVATKD